jgi:hypothetical protein
VRATGAEEEIWEEAEAEPRVREPRESPPGAPASRRVVVIDDDQDLDIKAGQEPLVRGPQRIDDPHPEATDEPTIGATLREDGEKRRWRLFRKGGD